MMRHDTSVEIYVNQKRIYMYIYIYVLRRLFLQQAKNDNWNSDLKCALLLLLYLIAVLLR